MQIWFEILPKFVYFWLKLNRNMHFLVQIQPQFEFLGIKWNENGQEGIITFSKHNINI